MKICFIGLGTMGLPMAQRLRGQGFAVAGWDVAEAARMAFDGDQRIAVLLSQKLIGKKNWVGK